MRLNIFLFLASFTAAHGAWATDAYTYQGTIAKLPIVAEFSEPDAKGKFVGRYSYQSKAGDIPLHGVQLKNGDGKLQEEAPCTDKLCKNASGDLLTNAPVSAEWFLQFEGDDLVGTWTDKKSGKSLPISLKMVGQRTLPESETVDLTTLDPMMLVGTTTALTPKSLPYDFLKVTREFKQGDVTELGDISYRIDTDTRINLPYPTILSLGSLNIKPLNSYLLQLRLQASLSSFYCLSTNYLGFGWSGVPGQGQSEVDSATNITVEHLTDRLMGFMESGSFDCGGAHPDNFANQRLVDVRSGKPVVAESLLRGWVAKDADGNVIDPSKTEDPSLLMYGPNDGLLKYVTDHLDPTIDADLKAECGFEDLMKTNLGVYFTQNDLVFTFKDLPHVAFACTVDLAKVPLEKAGPLLTKKGASYFAQLDK